MNNDVINEAQFGFVDKSNTETDLVHLLSTIYKNLEDGKSSDLRNQKLLRYRKIRQK